MYLSARAKNQREVIIAMALTILDLIASALTWSDIGPAVIVSALNLMMMASKHVTNPAGFENTQTHMCFSIQVAALAGRFTAKLSSTVRMVFFGCGVASTWS